MTDRKPERGSTLRTVALGGIVFVATLILLFGAINLVRRSDGAADGSTSAPFASVRPTPVRPTPVRTTDAVASLSPAPLGSGRPSGSASFDATLVGAGDIATCDGDGDRATAALVERIPGTVFTAGDNAYLDGSADQFRDCYGPTWGQFVDRTRPAAGNHDWQTEGLAGYLGYFGSTAAPSGVSWYSYELGAWHVIVLDSDCAKVGGCDAESPQGRWLATDLAAAASTRCTLAIWHHPRFSSGLHGNDDTVAPFWRALYDGGADLIVNGHDHDYERFAPQNPDGREDRARGIREFVVGTGGGELKTVGDHKPNSELLAAMLFGVIRLDLHATSYDWRFLPTAGDFTDSGTAPCH